MSKRSTASFIAAQVSRRGFLKLSAAAGATALMVGAGCGYYAAAEGDAYSPWTDFMDERQPELLIAAAATLAANPHNTQPWLFLISPTQIDLFADKTKSLGAMDSLHREMFIGLGCAIENAVVTARALGFKVEVTLMPDGDDSDHVATLRLEPGQPADEALFEALPKRHTNRGGYLDAPLPGLVEAMQGVLDTTQVRLTAHTSGQKRKAFIEGTIAATEAIIADAQMLADSDRWFRHSKEDIETYRTGVTLDATGKGSTTRFFGKIMETDSETSAQYWLDMTKVTHATGAAFCVLATPDRDDRRQQLACGRQYQRLHLWLTTQGLAAHPLNQMPERQDREQTQGLKADFTQRLAELYEPAGWGAQMLFRVGVANKDALPSPRQPLSWVTK